MRERHAVYVLEGSTIGSLSAFLVLFGEVVNGPGGYFGRDLESFDDCLFGGFGLANPCVIVWSHARAARESLDHRCLAQWCNDAIEARRYLDEDGLTWLTETRDTASKGVGPTMFDILVDMISSVGERSSGRCVIELQLR